MPSGTVHNYRNVYMHSVYSGFHIYFGKCKSLKIDTDSTHNAFCFSLGISDQMLQLNWAYLSIK